jgi:hypothetical protein
VTLDSKTAPFNLNGCDGELEFDSIASKKWGFAWKERLKCTKCDFVGQYHTLYYEVDPSGPGRKDAKLAGIILQFIVISRKLLLEIGVVIKPACKPILMVAAFLPGPEVSTS